ncbi:ABC transporter permease [Chitinophaga lutea]
MISNYLKIAWRSIWKSKQVSLINIVGLSVAIAVALLLSLTVYREFSFDKFHEQKQDIYQVYMDEFGTDRTRSRANLQYPLAPALMAEIPVVKRATRWFTAGVAMKTGEQPQNIQLIGSDEHFLEMFTFPAREGQTQIGPNDVLITERTAGRFFKGQDPIGKSVAIRLGESWKDYQVKGILKDIPNESSITFDVIMRIENSPVWQRDRENWENNSVNTFVQLQPGASPASFDARSRAFADLHFKAIIDDLKEAGARPGKNGGLVYLGLLPMKDVHFESYTLARLKRPMVYLLVFITIFLLFIASINFMNLTMARAFTRAKEVGMRKMLGAARLQLVAQFFGEALILFLISLAIALLLAWVLLPHFTAFLNNQLSYRMLLEPKILLGIFCALLFISLLAGGYPALALARMRTLQVLKGKVQSGRRNYLRNGLIVTQFVLSGFMICCTIVAWQQMRYLRTKPLGIDVQQVVSVPVGRELNGHQLLDRMRAALRTYPDVLSVSGGTNNVGKGLDFSQSTSRLTFMHKGNNIESYWMNVNFDYVKTLGLQLVDGRDFDPARTTDSLGLIINQRMAALLGKDVTAGYQFRLDDEDKESPMRTVVGIVKDYHFRSLHEAIGPQMMYIGGADDPPAYVFIRVAPQNLESTLATIEKAWKEVAPGQPFQGTFLDENTGRFYEGEKKVSQIFVFGAVLTIIISCMGLFAIAMMAIAQRTREIGVRKVLGASVVSITALVSRDFLKLVLLAILISSPLAWLAMGAWLEEYAYRISINVWVFVLAGLMAMLVAAVTISFQTIRAALMNPVRSLRTE